MSLGQFARQLDVMAANDTSSDKYDKWKLFRTVCEARSFVGIGDRSLAVLNALLSFYPEDDMALADRDTADGTGLIVFPSNESLSARSHGMAPATLRRHLAALVERGLIIRRDSPNGKRFRRKAVHGQEAVAYGFDLSPLVARAEEFENMAKHVRAEKAALKAFREELTIVRRDVSKLIEMALIEAIPGPWVALQEQLAEILRGLPRNSDAGELGKALRLCETLRERVHKLLETHLNSEEISANDAHNERHYHNSNTNPHIDLEPASERQQEENLEDEPRNPNKPQKTYPLGMVLQACPDISIYGPSNRVSSWRDLKVAADVAGTMLGISPSALEDAKTSLGPDHASIVVACMLQRFDRISSPGGYLRALTDKALDGKFSVGPMLMALLRQDIGQKQNVG